MRSSIIEAALRDFEWGAHGVEPAYMPGSLIPALAEHIAHRILIRYEDEAVTAEMIRCAYPDVVEHIINKLIRNGNDIIVFRGMSIP